MKKLLSRLALLSSVVILTACAPFKTAIPDGYAGPTAVLKDSANVMSTSKADMYYALTVDGNNIDNMRFKTRRQNEGRGMMMNVVEAERKIPARETKVSVAARTIYAAPILAMAGTVYQVTGDIVFTPEPNKAYVVRGTLDESYSAVWIEEELTKTVVGEKVEIKGSAKLGFFEK